MEGLHYLQYMYLLIQRLEIDLSVDGRQEQQPNKRAIVIVETKIKCKRRVL